MQRDARPFTWQPWVAMLMRPPSCYRYVLAFVRHLCCQCAIMVETLIQMSWLPLFCFEHARSCPEPCNGLLIFSACAEGRLG
jgi:hypothetical protein